MVNKCNVTWRFINAALLMNIYLCFMVQYRASCFCACIEDISGSRCIDPLICNLHTKYSVDSHVI